MSQQKIRTRCTHCSADFQVTFDAVGRQAQCATCGQLFVIEHHGSLAPEPWPVPSQPPAAQAPMPHRDATAVAPPGQQWTGVAPPAAMPMPPSPGGYFSPAMPPPQQGQAIAALVCGLLGMVSCPPVGAFGLFLGIGALKRANRDPARYGGRGLAIAGICLGIISTLFTIVAAALFLIGIVAEITPF